MRTRKNRIRFGERYNFCFTSKVVRLGKPSSDTAYRSAKLRPNFPGCSLNLRAMNQNSMNLNRGKILGWRRKRLWSRPFPAPGTENSDSSPEYFECSDLPWMVACCRPSSPGSWGLSQAHWTANQEPLRRLAAELLSSLVVAWLCLWAESLRRALDFVLRLNCQPVHFVLPPKSRKKEVPKGTQVSWLT